MSRLVIRHFEPADVDARTALLTDREFTRNLRQVGIVTPRDELRAAQLATIEQEYESKIIFVVATTSGQTIGFTWITDIDWLNRTCELSIALLPEFRRAYGLLALIETYDFLYREMNFATVVNQVLVGNEMLLSGEAAEHARQVYCRHDSFIAGELRDSRYWSQTRAQHEGFIRRTQERNARIRARLGHRRIPSDSR